MPNVLKMPSTLRAVAASAAEDCVCAAAGSESRPPQFCKRESRFGPTAAKPEELGPPKGLNSRSVRRAFTWHVQTGPTWPASSAAAESATACSCCVVLGGTGASSSCQVGKAPSVSRALHLTSMGSVKPTSVLKA